MVLFTLTAWCSHILDILLLWRMFYISHSAIWLLHHN